MNSDQKTKKQNKIRLDMYIDSHLKNALIAQALQLDINMSELIRRILSGYTQNIKNFGAEESSINIKASEGDLYNDLF